MTKYSNNQHMHQASVSAVQIKDEQKVYTTPMIKHQHRLTMGNKPSTCETRALSHGKAAEIHQEGGFLRVDTNSSPSAKDAITDENSISNSLPQF